jgi:hypothetical protein
MDNVQLASEGGKVYFSIETTFEDPDSGEGKVADRLNDFNAFRIPGYITFEYVNMENRFQQQSDKYPIEATLPVRFDDHCLVNVVFEPSLPALGKKESSPRVTLKAPSGYVILGQQPTEEEEEAEGVVVTTLSQRDECTPACRPPMIAKTKPNENEGFDFAFAELSDF